MIKNTHILLILTFSISLSISAQNKYSTRSFKKYGTEQNDSAQITTEEIANEINLYFTNDIDKSKALFYWITSNINYDIENQFILSTQTYDSTRISKVIETKKGICKDFTMLYKDIADKLGIKTYIITGYTKQNDEINYFSHTWCASLIDSTWYLTDPTWGSGYVENFKFINHTNFAYSLVSAEKLINTHIPFDPMWQFLNYPTTKYQFMENNIEYEKDSIYWNFKDSISNHESLSKIQQLESSYARIVRNEITNYLDADNLYHLEFSIKSEYFYINEEKYNLAADHYDSSIYFLNKYIDYKNDFYLPYKSDIEIVQMIDKASQNINSAFNQLEGITKESESFNRAKLRLKRNLQYMKNELDIHYQKLSEYLLTAKVYRKNLANNFE